MIHERLKILLVVFFYSVCGCRPAVPKLFERLNPAQSGIDFTNQLTYSDSLTVLEFEYMFNGAGVALLDVNQDGLMDVFFSGNMVSGKLFLNKGNLKFEDITEKAGLVTKGWSYGVSVVDINQDGYPDIYICRAGNRKTAPDDMRNLFYINNKNNTFTESAAVMGLDDDGYDVQAAFLDYDHDGDPDMYLLRNGFVNYNRNTVRLKVTDGSANSTNRLFRNNGNGTFTNVSKEAGITIEGFGLGVAVCDINNDNWPDVYVSNDFLTNDIIWINNRDGTFTNKAESMLRHTTYNAMGNDVADFNNDGKEDIAEVDMLPPDNKRWKLTMLGNTYERFNQGLDLGYQPQYIRNSLQLNNGDGTFSEIGRLAGVSATEWSWAPLFADFDNDGLKDLYIANGYRQDITNLDFVMYGRRSMMGTSEANRKDRIKMLSNFPGIKVRNYLFHNNGNLSFTDHAEDWGLEASYSNGAVYGDLDNDGDLDLVVNNLDEPSAVYENQLNKINPANKWLAVKLTGPAGNRDGLGAKINIWQGKELQYQYASPYRGYLSSTDPVIHFGLRNAAVDSLKVTWPDGKIQLLKNVQSNQLLKITNGNAHMPVDSVNVLSPVAMFTESHGRLNIFYRHQEDQFVDFKLQPLLPHLGSHEGPGISAGDMNGDGLDDFFAGAAAGSHAGIFIQQKKGGFQQQIMTDSNPADNMGALIFDADGDGDNDLYVANGGVCEKKAGDTVYRHRLYINDGKGKFARADNLMPAISTSGASVVGADYDHDGDIDLFVGGRISPGAYPLSPESFLLRNDSKNKQPLLDDITPQAGIPGKTMGMVSDALFTDFDNDGWADLIVVGEFMPVRLFKNLHGSFKEITAESGLAATGGWWNSIAGGDFDGDGDIDYVLGNLGLNGPYKASAEEPVCVYASDYDNNGRLDPVMCHYLDHTEFTVHSRDDLVKQMTAMRARFRDYASYAEAPFKESFRGDEIAKAVVVKAETFASSYLENLGNGKFRLTALPVEAQFSSINGMVSGDQDGYQDVLCAGNSFAPEVQTGRYDAQGSLLLRGNGKGGFVADRKALNVAGDNKALARLVDPDGRSLLVMSSNNDSLHAFTLNDASTRNLNIRQDETFAEITRSNGSKYREEFYFGNSYLSQSGRHLIVAHDTRQVIIHDTNGQTRTITF
jgi:enediyne biosynthesis protein E4